MAIKPDADPALPFNRPGAILSLARSSRDRVGQCSGAQKPGSRREAAMVSNPDPTLSTRRTFLGAMVGGGAVLTVGSGVASGQDKRLDEVKVFTGSNPSFGGIYIAQQKGFFESQGLPIQVTNFASGATAVDAFRAGRGDLVG